MDTQNGVRLHSTREVTLVNLLVSLPAGGSQRERTRTGGTPGR